MAQPPLPPALETWVAGAGCMSSTKCTRERQATFAPTVDNPPFGLFDTRFTGRSARKLTSTAFVLNNYPVVTCGIASRPNSRESSLRIAILDSQRNQGFDKCPLLRPRSLHVSLRTSRAAPSAQLRRPGKRPFVPKPNCPPNCQTSPQSQFSPRVRAPGSQKHPIHLPLSQSRDRKHFLTTS